MEFERLGVHPVIIRWIKPFSIDRGQLDNFKSVWKKTNSGLPHGTKWKPLLLSVKVISLLKDEQGRIKYVDEDSALKISLDTHQAYSPPLSMKVYILLFNVGWS
jgi:hypothetical protein